MAWKVLYRRAFELALDKTEVAEAAELLLARGERDRVAFDIARFHYLAQLDDYDDREVRNALAYIEEALWRGDLSRVWSLWGEVNPWEIGSSRFAA